MLSQAPVPAPRLKLFQVTDFKPFTGKAGLVLPLPASRFPACGSTKWQIFVSFGPAVLPARGGSSTNAFIFLYLRNSSPIPRPR